MTFDPMLPIPVLSVLFAISTVLLLVLVWKGSRGISTALRILITLVYLVVNGCIFTFLANPGTSETYKTEELPVFLVVSDKSSSMTVPDGDENKATRDAAAMKLAEIVSKAEADNMELAHGIIHDGFKVLEDGHEPAKSPADGAESRLVQGLTQAINHYRTSGRMLAGVLFLSDGRDTANQAPGSLIRSAASQGIPLHTVCIGGDWSNPDIELQAVRSMVSTYPGTRITMGARIKNTGMGQVSLPVLLVGDDDEIIERKHVELKDGEESLVQFNLDAGDKSKEYAIRTSVMPGEQNSRNNTVHVSLRIVTTPIRVFMAEGAPYWDSKFLAQLLRRQPIFNVKSVHRLTNERYFQLNTEDASSNAEADGGLPTTIDDFRKFDMIILGKGAEHMITPDRARALQSYVRDMGGLLIFARGKSYAGDFPELAALEPFTWKNVTDADHPFTPSVEGVEDGLFGQLLPGRHEPVWESLPPLTDVWDIDSVAPFTRILARSDDNSTPLLAVRRIGLGAVVMINGDGMWKWDFYPEAKRWGNSYEDFWTQFLQWTQTSSEFIPGYDLSLRAERATVMPQQPIAYHMSWRGDGQPESILVKLYPVGSEIPAAEQEAAFEGKQDGLPRWTGKITAPGPGYYILRPAIPGRDGISLPEVKIHIPLPPGEQDNLNANPDFMAALAESTGGKFLKPGELEQALPEILIAPDTYEYTEEMFTPCWNRWYYLLSICLLLSLAWWIRRRHGLL